MTKRMAVLCVSLVGLVVSLTGFSLIANLNLGEVLARYPGAEARHFNWRSVHKGYVSQEAVYQTGDEVMNVWRSYARQFGVKPTGGMNAEGRCVELTKTDELVFFRRTVTARLCAITHGTQIFFNQVLYMPFRLDFSGFPRFNLFSR